MTGGSPKTQRPIQPDPTPSPAPIEEMVAAKDSTKRQAAKKGRGSTILANRMMQNSVLNFGKSKVGE